MRSPHRLNCANATPRSSAQSRAFEAAPVAPDADLGARLWRRLEPRLVDAGVIAPRPSVAQRLRAWLAPPRAARACAWAGAFAIVLAIGVGLSGWAQQRERDAAAVASAGAGSRRRARVLDAYVAAHLRATEGVLLTASNSDDASLLEGNRELAESLVESNRLYALAAARAGNARLAEFLRQLEPVLLSLANQSGAATVQSSEDLRQYLGRPIYCSRFARRKHASIEAAASASESRRRLRHMARRHSIFITMALALALLLGAAMRARGERSRGCAEPTRRRTRCTGKARRR